MKANELRIGNHVIINNHATNIVDNIAFDYDEGAWYVDDIHIALVKPIPLTEDWLLKFGFVFTEIHSGFNQYRCNLLELSITPNGFEIFFNIKWINIRHVDQLQNLYFALTGQELTIKQ